MQKLILLFKVQKNLCLQSTAASANVNMNKTRGDEVGQGVGVTFGWYAILLLLNSTCQVWDMYEGLYMCDMSYYYSHVTVLDSWVH